MSQKVRKSEKSDWHPQLDSYRELRAVSFESDEDLRKALKLLWTSDELFGLPRDVIGGTTMVIPAEALHYFKGLRFTATEVLSSGSISPEERTHLRREQGHH